MPKVLFTVSYEINPEKREEYLALVKEMKDHFVSQKQKNYTVYEQQGRKNSFVELFTCESMEEYDSLEDDQDEKTEGLVQRLEELLDAGKMRYSTLLEIL